MSTKTQVPPGAREGLPSIRRRINIFFSRLTARKSILILLFVAVIASEIVSVGVNYILFRGILISETAITALITTTVVSLPLIVLCVLTIRHLDATRDLFRQMRDRAVHESQIKSQFLANTSHELRTPLNAIIGFSEIMESEIFGPIGSERYKEYVADIRESGDHLLSVINSILEVSRYEAGAIELKEEEIDLEDALKMPVRLVEQRALRNDVRILVNIADQLPRLYADPRMFQRIMINILSNAVKFSHQGGVVQVVVEVADAGNLSIAVIDQGMGIAPEDLERVLEPFALVHNVQSQNLGGVGLGLSLVKSMMEMHSGTVQLFSDGKHGTTAALTFPGSRLRSSSTHVSAPARA